MGAMDYVLLVSKKNGKATVDLDIGAPDGLFVVMGGDAQGTDCISVSHGDREKIRSFAFGVGTPE